MWEDLARALCLMLVIEGTLPFLYPQRWRRVIATLATASDRQLRTMGLISMLAGAAILFLISR